MAKKKAAKKKTAKKTSGVRGTPRKAAAGPHTVWALTCDQGTCDAVIRRIYELIAEGTTRFDDIADDIESIAPRGMLDDYLACFYSLMSRAKRREGPFRLNGINVSVA